MIQLVIRFAPAIAKAAPKVASAAPKAAPMATRVGKAAGFVETNSVAISQAYDIIKPIIEKSMQETGQDLDAKIKDMQVIPKDTGALEQSQRIEQQEKGFNIHYDSPYAARLYYHPEYNFRTDKNNNAQGKWLESIIREEDINLILANHTKEKM